MSERCNLKNLTAALCCFYHKNSVISAKVRGRRVCESKSTMLCSIWFVWDLYGKHVCKSTWRFCLQLFMLQTLFLPYHIQVFAFLCVLSGFKSFLEISSKCTFHGSHDLLLSFKGDKRKLCWPQWHIRKRHNKKTKSHTALYHFLKECMGTL